MAKRAPQIPDWVEVEGARGGSFVRLSKSDKEGFCNIEVGHSCVITVGKEMPVTWLAAILTRVEDTGLREAMGDPDQFPADYALMCDPEAQ